MSAPARPVRDILAECMRRERIGLARPLWEDWTKFGDEECEIVRKRADHLLRLLGDHGVTLVQDGTPTPERKDSPEVWRFPLVGEQVERVVRLGADGRWVIATVEKGKETVEQTFTIAEASIDAGKVLIDAPEARTIQGLGRKLAAVIEILLTNAHNMGVPK